jgi:hypothetical protein
MIRATCIIVLVSAVTASAHAENAFTKWLLGATQATRPAAAQAATAPKPSPALAQTAQAQALIKLEQPGVATSDLNGVDVSDLINYFKPIVHSLKQSVLVYNWMEVSTVGYYQQTLGLHDTVAYRRAVRSATSFWINFNGGISANMFGFGLYAALDPKKTRSFGGDDHWMLTQMQLPVGFRLIDMTHDEDTHEFTDAVKAKLLQFGCSDATIVDLINPVMKNVTCSAVVKKIFHENLRIDGFIYSYTSNSSELCPEKSAPVFGGAMVITSNRWMVPQAIETFVPLMKDGAAERSRIMTLMASGLDEQLHPMWSDIPVKTDPNLQAWAKANILGCQDQLPY